MQTSARKWLVIDLVYSNVVAAILCGSIAVLLKMLADKRPYVFVLLAGSVIFGALRFVRRVILHSWTLFRLLATHLTASGAPEDQRLANEVFEEDRRLCEVDSASAPIKIRNLIAGVSVDGYLPFRPTRRPPGRETGVDRTAESGPIGAEK